MIKVSIAWQVFCTALWTGTALTAFGQQQVIFTTRDATIGLVTFGSTVVSGVLGDQVYIDGYIKKKGADTFIYPVGDNGAYRPFAASADQTYGAYFQADPSIAITSDPRGGNYGVLPQGGPFSTANLDKALGAVSTREYWDINGASPTKITLSWNQQSELAALVASGGLAKLTMAGWDGAKWVKISSTIDTESLLGANSTMSTGSITSTVALAPDTYNVYTLGVEAGSALPVTLISFKARAQEQTVYLEWETSQEKNSSHFDVERSRDASLWIKIGRVTSQNAISEENEGGGRYDLSDLTPAAGINYYRLKMVDLDSTFAYSQITHVELGGGDIVVYPNPVLGKIHFKGPGLNQLSKATLISATGAVIRSFNDFTAGVAVGEMASGMYLLNMSFKDGTHAARQLIISK
ncbi:MAG: T9SS type A sorting domain-containing protein [Dyadobacter sp.]|uniref:T9SS type A sorting domain-containing protein n=1 Tax=Dyadobacter sp. TaxID=1914288 RepID=UPI003264D0C3